MNMFEKWEGNYEKWAMLLDIYTFNFVFKVLFKYSNFALNYKEKIYLILLFGAKIVPFSILVTSRWTGQFTYL